MNRMNHRFVLVSVFVLVLNASVIAQDVTESPPNSKSMIGPWNIAALKSKVPGMKWVRDDQPIRSLLYAGEGYQGRPTEVFAFYASPATLGAAKTTEKFPGVVLIHGGGGTAFAKWVHMWASRGYAAIAMDLSGRRPPDPEFDKSTGNLIGSIPGRGQRERLGNGGPEQGHPEKFGSVGGSTSDDWPFHAVASVMRAHTLLRSFPEVDARRTAVTGISWGGYTTCLVASLDDRFKAAVPVYGCGFLHEGESVQKPAIDALHDRRTEWVKLYDPGSHLPRCRVPMFFVNGTNDKHYPLDSYSKSYQAVPGSKQMRIVVKMPHSHQAGWRPKEIGLFIDSYCRDGIPLPVVKEPTIDGDRLTVICGSRTALRKAELHFSGGSGLRATRSWQTVPAKINGRTITVAKPPNTANTWFLTITDDRGAIVSTGVHFRQ